MELNDISARNEMDFFHIFRLLCLNRKYTERTQHNNDLILFSFTPSWRPSEGNRHQNYETFQLAELDFPKDVNVTKTCSREDLPILLDTGYLKIINEKTNKVTHCCEKMSPTIRSH